MGIARNFRLKLTYTQTIVIGFFLIILVGALLLMLPISSRERNWTSFSVACFTATSATCVTGLQLFDTYLYWSFFGQLIILFMIQVGGIGFMTLLTMFSLFIKRKIGLHERKLMMETSGMLHLSGVVRLIKRILFGVLVIEGIGALLLAVRFIPLKGFWHGVYHAIFLSVSAFNNAGFDLMGEYGPFSSLQFFANDMLVTLTVSVLVFLGGIGYIIWDDIVKHKFNFSKYELHTKIVLSTTGILIGIGWLCFFIFEGQAGFYGLSWPQKLLQAFFYSITLRTAGFMTFDIHAISESGSLLTLIFMFIGASSGSTGGGIKVTTFAILVLSAVATARQRRNITIFKRQIDNETVKKASAMFMIYLAVVMSMTLLLTVLEPYSMKEALFETISAITTVGLSLGITPSHGLMAQLVIMLLMFIGRIGFLTLVFAFGGKHIAPPIERVTEKILIG